jgi:hypothetical protein
MEKKKNFGKKSRLLSGGVREAIATKYAATWQQHHQLWEPTTTNRAIQPGVSQSTTIYGVA